jgi:hypothetical protein
MVKHYKAHWSTLLVGLSALQTAVCLYCSWLAWTRGAWWVSAFLLALPLGCALFSIRGYTITSDAILVHRLEWVTTLPLAGLKSAAIQPAHILRGIRIGNGGFFSFTGWRYSPGRGFHRVFITDHRNGVILNYSKRRVVLSPNAPQEFLHDLPLPIPTH